MARPAARHPTELELQILKIIWRCGPVSIHRVRDELAPTRPLAYTSVQTMMNIMVTKGYLRRDKDSGSYVYRARVSEQSTRRRMLHDLVDRVFDGSAGAAALHLLESSDIVPEEVAQLRRLLARKAKERSS
jgi:BlaI family transcriptional regulator, penicillinase repressor